MRGFIKGVSVMWMFHRYLLINDILEYNSPYVQSGSDNLTITMIGKH